MPYADTLKIFEILRPKFDEEQAKVITEAIESIEQALETNQNNLATKKDIADLKSELKVEIAQTKAELLKWLFLFWVGQVAVVFALAKLIR